MASYRTIGTSTYGRWQRTSERIRHESLNRTWCRILRSVQLCWLCLSKCHNQSLGLRWSPVFRLGSLSSLLVWPLPRPDLSHPSVPYQRWVLASVWLPPLSLHSRIGSVQRQPWVVVPARDWFHLSRLWGSVSAVARSYRETELQTVGWLSYWLRYQTLVSRDSSEHCSPTWWVDIIGTLYPVVSYPHLNTEIRVSHKYPPPDSNEEFPLRLTWVNYVHMAVIPTSGLRHDLRGVIPFH